MAAVPVSASPSHRRRGEHPAVERRPVGWRETLHWPDFQAPARTVTKRLVLPPPPGLSQSRGQGLQARRISIGCPSRCNRATAESDHLTQTRNESVQRQSIAPRRAIRPSQGSLQKGARENGKFVLEPPPNGSRPLGNDGLGSRRWGRSDGRRAGRIGRSICGCGRGLHESPGTYSTQALAAAAPRRDQNFVSEV